MKANQILINQEKSIDEMLFEIINSEKNKFLQDIDKFEQ